MLYEFSRTESLVGKMAVEKLAHSVKDLFSYYKMIKMHTLVNLLTISEWGRASSWRGVQS